MAMLRTGVQSAVVTALALCALCTCARAAYDEAKERGWTPYNYPNPRKRPQDCGLGSNAGPGNICDPEGLLESAEIRQLETQIQRIANKTKCPCSDWFCTQDGRGYRVGIALLNKMRIPGEGPGQPDDTITDEDMSEKMSARQQVARRFSYRLLTTWKLGRCREHAIILFSARDHTLYLMAERLAGKHLKPSVLGQIALTNLGHLPYGGGRQGNKQLMDGLQSILGDFQRAFKSEYPRKDDRPPPRAESVTGGSPVMTSAISLTLTLILAAMFS